MRVAGYREVIAAVRRSAVDFHACVDAGERLVWERHARNRLQEGLDASCPRASQDDRERMADAIADLQQLIASVDAARHPPAGVFSPAAGALRAAPVPRSRAARYNQSPARAVRLRRAARSAMRRGYI